MADLNNLRSKRRKTSKVINVEVPDLSSNFASQQRPWTKSEQSKDDEPTLPLKDSDSADVVSENNSDRIKEVSIGTHQYSPVPTSTHQYSPVPTNTTQRYFYGYSPVLTGTQLSVLTGTHLKVISESRKEWRDCFCLVLKFLNESQPDNVPLKTNGSIIQQATGLAPSTVKNALNKAQKLGFIMGEKGKGGRWRSYLAKSITPLGYALIASEYFQKVISNSPSLSVLTSTHRYSSMGTHRYPMTDRQNIKSVCLSGDWESIANSKEVIGLTPETLVSDLLSKKPDRWTTEEFLESMRIWNHRKKVDPSWFARIKKSEWKTFVAEMLSRGAIDPRPGYKTQKPVQEKVEPVPPIETQPTAEELENERLAELKKTEFLKFSESEEGLAFKEKHGKKAYVAWLKFNAIKENPLIKDILSF